MLESLYNAYVEDDQSGGMFAGPNRKDIEKALDEIPSYLAERFIENVAKIAPESIKGRYESLFVKYMENYVLEYMPDMMRFAEGIMNKYANIPRKSWTELSDLEKQLVLSHNTGLDLRDVYSHAYSQLLQKGFIIFEGIKDAAKLLCGHELLTLIQNSATDGSDLVKMLGSIEFIFISESDIEPSDKLEILKNKR